MTATAMGSGHPHSQDAAATPPRILVVDDVFDNRDILTRRLVRRGFEVVEASGGIEALEKIRASTFDLVLLDVMMPDMDGNEVLRNIRQTMGNTELPIIMVTAKSQSEDVVESLNLGANDYVTKPVDFAITVARINAQLERTRNARAARQMIEQKATDLHVAVERNIEELRTASEQLAHEANKRQQSDQKLKYLAYHDTLTGLLNRTAFRERLTEALRAPAPAFGGPTLLFIDLDHFKAVNDVHGHEVGDRLLQQVAARLLDAAGIEVPVARLGGDEFAIFLSDGPSEKGMVLAQQIVDVLQESFLIGGQSFRIGACCGVAHAGDVGADIEVLLKAADLAMYHAKSSGRGRPARFEPAMLEEQRERNALEVDLRQAVQEGALEVHYQPLINARTGEVTAFEALVRWPHPERGLVPPDRFIGLAEETGLIIPLGIWVLRRACAEAVAWPEHIRVAVNLSPLQFRDRNLVPSILDALAVSGLTASRLDLEITESALLEAGEQNIEILRAIRALGIRVSMDDFGTGYSSMLYLKDFEFDKIKIDRRFVRGLNDGGSGAAIIHAIVELGASIGVGTTAEGVETEEEQATVMSHGCNEMQGYLFGRPMTAEDARTFIEDAASRTKGD